jgi:hypothetical protein
VGEFCVRISTGSTRLLLFGNISTSWCDPFKTWQKVGLTICSCKIVGGLMSHQSYTFDPLARMTEAQAKLVLGGSFSMSVLSYANLQLPRRPATTLDRTVLTRKSRLDRLASSSQLCRGLLDRRNSSRWQSTKCLFCAPAYARY